VPRRPSGGTVQAFLLTGDDGIARKERLDQLVSERLDETARAFNLDRLSARDADPASVATLLQTPPLLGDVRVVVLEDVEAASRGVEQAVADFLKAPPPSTCLIALGQGRLAAEPWKTLRGVGVEETFEPPRGRAEMETRVRELVRRTGMEIDPEAVSLLTGLNEDPDALATEVAKLVARLGERRRIETADVEAVVVSSARGNVYTCVDLVGMGRREEALAELHALLEAGESPLYLVTLLAQHFLLLGGIRACEARGIRSADAIARALDKPMWMLSRNKRWIPNYRPPLEQARRYDRAAVDRWLAGLLDLDLALKSSRLPPAALMEESVLRLMSDGRRGPALEPSGKGLTS
jgi:DNA polymerase III delta subunit